MKWLKNIFKGSEAKGETLTLPLSQIESWLVERQKDSGYEEHLQEIYGRIEEVANEFAKDIESLRSAKANEATPPKLLRAGLAARGEMVKQMETLAEKMMPPKQKDIESAAAHHWTLIKGLERTVTTYGRGQRYVAALFPKIIESINSDMTHVTRLMVELEEEIDKKRKVQEEIWYSKELVAALSEELSGIEELERNVLEYERKLAGILATSSGLQAELKVLTASDEGKKTAELKHSLEEKQNELEKVESEMADLIAPLTKALTRIRKQGSSDRLDIQHSHIFEQLSISPSKVCDQDISPSLEELRRHLTSLGLKDKKKEKILDHIDRLVRNNSLQGTKSKRSDLEEEIKDLEVRIYEISRGANQLKEELNRSKKIVQSLQASLDQSQKNLAALKEKASRDETELNERLSKLAKRPVAIDFSSGK